jgi:heme/copper-type cytochrome/quinol oxidase subunit 4
MGNLNCRSFIMEKTRSHRFRRHVLATLCSIGIMTLIPSASYVGLIVRSGDLGGPLNIVFIPAVSAVIGFVISLLVFLPLSLFVENSDFQRWWRIVGFVLSGIVAIVVLAWAVFGARELQNRAYLFIGAMAVYVASGFFVYLCGLAIGTRIWGKS